MNGRTFPSDDGLDPARRATLRALLVEHARATAATDSPRATRRRIVGVAVGVGALAAVTTGALAIAFTGIAPGQSPALPVPSTASAPAPAPSPTVAPAPTSTPAPPTAPPSSPVGTLFTAQKAYDLCVAAADPWDSVVTTPEGDLPPAPTISLAPVDQSEVDEYVAGVWTVVIPVVREYPDGARNGIKVCTIGGTVESPELAVTDSLD